MAPSEARGTCWLLGPWLAEMDCRQGMRVTGPIPNRRHPRLPDLLAISSYLCSSSSVFGKGDRAKGFYDLRNRAALWLFGSLTLLWR